MISITDGNRSVTRLYIFVVLEIAHKSLEHATAERVAVVAALVRLHWFRYRTEKGKDHDKRSRVFSAPSCPLAWSGDSLEPTEAQQLRARLCGLRTSRLHSIDGPHESHNDKHHVYAHQPNSRFSTRSGQRCRSTQHRDGQD